tara:strand:- start:434 stop:631 length:198 start_codon:yes stop_codon:yes gene_type:complete
MVPLSCYTKNQQDIIMRLASLNLMEITFNDKGAMCVYMTDEQGDIVDSFADLDDDHFIKLFNIDI